MKCVNVESYVVEGGTDRPSPGPYLRKGQRGPGPGRQISRGGILKKSRLKYGMWGEKKAVHVREI
jgi:hypothetical protein